MTADQAFETAAECLARFAADLLLNQPTAVDRLWADVAASDNTEFDPSRLFRRLPLAD